MLQRGMFVMKRKMCLRYRAAGLVLTLAGAALLLILMPGWAWLLVIGAALIAAGLFILIRTK